MTPTLEEFPVTWLERLNRLDEKAGCSPFPPPVDWTPQVGPLVPYTALTLARLRCAAGFTVLLPMVLLVLYLLGYAPLVKLVAAGALVVLPVVLRSLTGLATRQREQWWDTRPAPPVTAPIVSPGRPLVIAALLTVAVAGAAVPSSSNAWAVVYPALLTTALANQYRLAHRWQVDRGSELLVNRRPRLRPNRRGFWQRAPDSDAERDDQHGAGTEDR